MAYGLVILAKVRKFIDGLSVADQMKVTAHVEKIMIGEFKSLYIKTLHSPLKELIIGSYRFIFFIDKGHVYFVNSFLKKTQKTPRQEIQLAEKNYKQIINNI